MSKYSQDIEKLNKYRRNWIEENKKIETRTYSEWIKMYISFRQQQNKFAKIEYNDIKIWYTTQYGETYDEPFILPYDNIYPPNPDTEEGKIYMKSLKEYINYEKRTHKFNKPPSLGITSTKGYTGTQTIKHSVDVTNEAWTNMITYLRESPPDIAEESIKRYLRTPKDPVLASMMKVHDQVGPSGKYIRINGKWVKEE